LAKVVNDTANSPTLRHVGTYRVLFADCDPMRIMYYGSYLRLFELGRAELFRSLGHPFTEYISRGLYLAVIEAHCEYLRPARYDDVLDIFAGLAEVGKARLRIDYEVRLSNASSTLARGYTCHAVVNELGRPVRIPEEFRALVAQVAVGVNHTPSSSSG
jgi:acyl-CoA thioester hydrolase